MSLGTFALIVVGLLAVAMQPGDTPRRLGEIASRLSTDDISELQRLAGEGSWLLIGHRGQFSSNWSVEVYGRPLAADPMLRRGAMVWAWTDSSWLTDLRFADAEPPTPRQWRTDATMKMSWAQVALADRPFEDVRDQRDLNRPFRLVGTFGDAELVKLVDFVRVGPQTPGADGLRIVDRTLPIAHVERRPDGLVEVRLPVSEWMQQVVTIRPSGEAWSLVQVGEWID